jgi:Mn-dependent DtxR family transcriptional regulator
MADIPILQNKISIPYLMFLYEHKRARKSEILKGIGVSPTTATLYHKLLMRSGLTEHDPNNKKLIQLTKKGMQLCRNLLTCRDICEEAIEDFEKENPDFMNKLDKEIGKKQKRILDSMKAVDKLKRVFD